MPIRFAELQAAAAAEAVLWRLTGLVIDAAADLQRLLDAVRHGDARAAGIKP